MFGDAPTRAEAKVNVAMPASRNYFRPNMSESFPTMGTQTTELSM